MPSKSREKLIEENNGKEICTECGIINHWNMRPLLMEVYKDRLVCPNCKSQIENWRKVERPYVYCKI